MLKISMGIAIGTVALGLLFYWLKKTKKTKQLKQRESMAGYGIEVLQHGQLQALDTRKYVRSLTEVSINIDKKVRRNSLTLPHIGQANYVLIHAALSWMDAFPYATNELYKQTVYYKVSGNRFDVSFDRISDKSVEVPTYREATELTIEGILIAYE